MFAPPARKKRAQNWPTCSLKPPARRNSGTATKTTAVQTNSGPRGEKCRDRTDDLLIWKAPHAQYTGIGATCRRVADTGQNWHPRTTSLRVHVSERTENGTDILRKRNRYQTATGHWADNYIYREDGRSGHSQRTVTLSHLQSGSQTQTSPTGWPLALRPARRSRINISTLSIESTLKWCCIVAIVCRHNDWQTKKSESTPSKSEKVCPPKLTMTPAQYSRFLPARSTVISGMLSADGFSGASQ